MKKYLTLILTLCFILNSNSQIKFEKGYFITDSDQKTECLIKNIDWENNPTEFQYKLSENSETKNITIENVKSFGLYNISKYVRSKVNIDRSTEIVRYLDENRNPEFKNEQLFLKVLVEGKSNLYEYQDGNLERYFYNIENSDIEQLIFKKYKNEDGKIATNVGFKQQILNNLECDNINLKKIENLRYDKRSLIPFFIDYNTCTNSVTSNFETNEKENLFHLNLRVGLSNSSMSIKRNPNEFEFDNQLTFRFGAELEQVLSFNKNKWSVLIEPNYQYFKANQTETTTRPNSPTPRTTIYNIDFKTIDLSLGIRHYIFITDQSKLFINGSALLGFSLNSAISINQSTVNYNIKKITNSIGFGGGYNYKDKYSFEFRYQTDRSIINARDDGDPNFGYGTLSFILGYRVF